MEGERFLAGAEDGVAGGEAGGWGVVPAGVAVVHLGGGFPAVAGEAVGIFYAFVRISVQDVAPGVVGVEIGDIEVIGAGLAVLIIIDEGADGAEAVVEVEVLVGGGVAIVLHEELAEGVEVGFLDVGGLVQLQEFRYLFFKEHINNQLDGGSLESKYSRKIGQ